MSIANYNAKKAAEKKAAEEAAKNPVEAAKTGEQHLETVADAVAPLTNSEEVAEVTGELLVPPAPGITSTGAPIPPTDPAALVQAQMDANKANEATSLSTEKWVSPYDVDYKELTELLGKKDLAAYVGDNLPEEEVKRIDTDYQLYLKNK